MSNELRHFATRQIFAIRAASFVMALGGLAGTDAGSLLSGWTISRSVLADEPPAVDPSKPNVLTTEEQESIAEFQKLYKLEKGQVLKYVKAPFVAGRRITREHRWNRLFENGDYQKPSPGRAGLIPYCYVYFERNGELALPHHFCSGSDQTEADDRAIDLISLMQMIANVSKGNLIDPKQRLKKGQLAGDWVIRKDAPIEQIIVALGQILNRECGLPITLKTREDSEDVVIVRGRANAETFPKLDSSIKLYTNTFRADQGKREQGSFPEFLTAIGQFIEPNRRVIGETENPPKTMVAWHRNVPDRFDDGDVDSVLDHLNRQTGLKFTLETLKTRKIIVEPK